MGSIDIEEAIKRPVDIMMGNYGFFIPPLLPAVVNLISVSAVGKPGFGFHISPALMVLSLIAMILSLIAGGALVYMADDELKGYPADYREGLSEAVERIADLVIAAVVIGIGAFIGLLLLVIPGLIWLMLTAFTLPLIMLDGLDAISAIKGSINLVKENFGDVLVYLIVLVIIVGAGMIILGLIPYVGYALATIILNPYSAISITIAYRQLTGGEPGGEVTAETF